MNKPYTDKKYMLSIDGGASSVRAGIIDLKNGNIEHEVKLKSPFNFEVFKNGTFNKTLNKIFLGANDFEITSCVFGIAGMDTIDEKTLVTNEINLYLSKRQSTINKALTSTKIYILNDIELVLHNGSIKDENKIAIIAGTGSNCIGINKKGDAAKAGGLDYFLTDQGSGYYIGKQALEIAVKKLDGRIEKTELGREILQALKVNDIYELKKVVYGKNFTKKQTAKLTINVVKCMLLKKDEEAKKILKNAAHELFLHINAVAKNLNIQEFTVIESGSVFKINYVKQCFEREVRQEYDKVTFYTPSLPSYYGGYNYVKSLI